jgi:hypothetical protein
MMKKILTSALIALFVTLCYGFFNDYEPSAKARGMSGAVTATSDDFLGIFYNPAGLKYAENTVGATFYHLHGNDFSAVTALGGSFMTTLGTIGVGFQQMAVEYYDINLMSEQKFSVGHAFYLNKDIHSEVSFGYSANLYSLSYHELGSEMAVGINAGMIAILHQRTRMGFMLSNINKPKMGESEKHEIPQMLAVGLAYIPYQGVITAIDLKKNWEGATELRSGVEVEIHPVFKLRMGVRNNPASYSFGAGFEMLGVTLDYGANSHAVLNITHHISLGYKF